MKCSRCANALEYLAGWLMSNYPTTASRKACEQARRIAEGIDQTKDLDHAPNCAKRYGDKFCNCLKENP